MLGDAGPVIGELQRGKAWGGKGSKRGIKKAAARGGGRDRSGGLSWLRCWLSAWAVSHDWRGGKGGWVAALGEVWWGREE